jgi:3-dehydroquinate dehydratase-2
MRKIIIINGPNLNLLGKREPSVYGNQSFETYFETLKQQFGNAFELAYFQSNHEGEIIDKLHEVGFSYEGIILNGGAYTHTSIAIADAISAITTPVVEVHISNVYAREAFRHHSHFSAKCKGVIVGMGLTGYALAILAFVLGTNTDRGNS